MKTNHLYINFLFTTAFSVILFLSATAQQRTSNSNWQAPEWTDTLKNPYAHNAAMTNMGKDLYQKTCSVCHGATGKGDGVAASGLMVKPANHTSDQVQRETDGALFYKITNGRSPMPSFKPILTEKQRWALVNYLRTFKNREMAKKK